MFDVVGDYSKCYYNFIYLVNSFDFKYIWYVEYILIKFEVELFFYFDNISEKLGEGVMLCKISVCY